MKIAVISDIHENFHNLLKTLEICRRKSVAKILCLGDLINPGIAKVLADCAIPVFSIWGNNDGEKVIITRFSLASGSNLKTNDKTYAILEEGGRRIFITHYPELAKPMAKSGEFDAVFYGHDHLQSQEWVGDCLVVNPGEISAHMTGKATFAVYDTQVHQVEFVTLEDAVTLKTPYVDQWMSGKS